MRFTKNEDAEVYDWVHDEVGRGERPFVNAIVNSVVNSDHEPNREPRRLLHWGSG